MTADGFDNDRHGWSELLPDRVPGRRLRGRQQARWVVIGAGFTGLACARRLAELNPQEQILLLEARSVGQGASGRNSGFAVAVSHFPGPYQADCKAEYARVNRINRTGLDLLRQAVAGADIDCQWREEGFHHAAAGPAAVAECSNFQRYLQEIDVAHTDLDADALSARLGSGLYRRGVHVHDGALVQPAALVRGLADTLPENVTLYENSPVLAISGREKPLLELADGEVRCEALFVAVNHEAPRLGFLQRRLAASTLSGSLTRVLTAEERASLGNLADWGVLSLHGGGATVRLTVDGRINLRNDAGFRAGRLLSAAELGKRQAIHRAAFERRFPDLKHVPFEYAWSGVEGLSRNGTNFFGRQHGNIFLAGGYNGSGVSRGTAFGAVLAEYAMGGQSPLLDDCLAVAPAAWIPPRPFLDLAAMAMVRARFRGVGLDR